MDAICREYGDYDKMPIGSIIGKCNLSNIVPVEQIRNEISVLEKACGDYSNNRFAWKLIDIDEFTEAIPAKGKQGLWNWEG
jgi:hypothetical protein